MSCVTVNRCRGSQQPGGLSAQSAGTKPWEESHGSLAIFIKPYKASYIKRPTRDDSYKPCIAMLIRSSLNIYTASVVSINGPWITSPSGNINCPATIRRRTRIFTTNLGWIFTSSPMQDALAVVSLGYHEFLGKVLGFSAWWSSWRSIFHISVAKTHSTCQLARTVCLPFLWLTVTCSDLDEAVKEE